MNKSHITSNQNAYNYRSYNDTPIGENDFLLVPFDTYKKQTIQIDKDFKNRHSEIKITKQIESIKHDVDESHGHLNMHFKLIDYLSISNH